LAGDKRSVEEVAWVLSAVAALKASSGVRKVAEDGDATPTPRPPPPLLLLLVMEEETPLPVLMRATN